MLSQCVEAHLFEARLDEVGLVDETLLEVCEAVFLEAERLLPRQFVGNANLREERRQVVELHLLFAHLLLLLLLLLHRD